MPDGNETGRKRFLPDNNCHDLQRPNACMKRSSARTSAAVMAIFVYLFSVNGVNADRLRLIARALKRGGRKPRNYSKYRMYSGSAFGSFNSSSPFSNNDFPPSRPKAPILPARLYYAGKCAWLVFIRFRLAHKRLQADMKDADYSSVFSHETYLAPVTPR